MKKFLSLILALCTLLVLTSCMQAKTAAKTADEVAAQLLCGQSFAMKQGISVDEAIATYCETRPTWKPWLDAALAARQHGAAVAAGETPPVGALGCPAGSTLAPTPAPGPSPAQSPPQGHPGAK